jgi:hypothetical protein
MAMDIWVNLFSSVLVMFFLFYVFIKFFLRIFEDRIKFMERLYDGVVDELRSLVRELHLLRVEVGVLIKGDRNLKHMDIDEEVDENGNG